MSWKALSFWLFYFSLKYIVICRILILLRRVIHWRYLLVKFRLTFFCYFLLSWCSFLNCVYCFFTNIVKETFTALICTNQAAQKSYILEYQSFFKSLSYHTWVVQTIGKSTFLFCSPNIITTSYPLFIILHTFFLSYQIQTCSWIPSISNWELGSATILNVCDCSGSLSTAESIAIVPLVFSGTCIWPLDISSSSMF